MKEFKVVEGRQSHLYNHFKEYELVSCRATETRLMGAVALKLSWQDAADSRRRYYQIIHLDYSEYGIDEYLEYDCMPGDENYSELRSDMQSSWNHFINVMGGQAVNISPACMLRLLGPAIEIAAGSREREYDPEENVSFRKFAIQRLDMMRDVLSSRGITADDCSEFEAIDAVSVKNIGQYAGINYFLMRLLDGDFSAAAFLSEIPKEELEKSELASRGIQTLMKNSISKVPKRDNPRASERLRMYNCHLTSLAREEYYHSSLSIWLDGGVTDRDALVIDMDIGSSTLLSDYEAAVQLSSNEYITVFDVSEDIFQTFDFKYISSLSRADKSPCENGLLLTIYNQTNEHVEKPDYKLSDDVYGYALLSSRRELILMSTDLSRISMLDGETAMSVYSPYITVKGRFQMDSPVFHTLCHTPGLSTDDMIDSD